MAAFVNTVTIMRPAGEVFAYLADTENIPRWNYAIERTRKITPGPAGVGTVYRQTRTIPSRSQEDFEIVVFQPPGQLALDGTFGPFKARTSYLLEPATRSSGPQPNFERDRLLARLISGPGRREWSSPGR
jgi:Polyketide cyclase / dehydrase and lipid transport